MERIDLPPIAAELAGLVRSAGRSAQASEPLEASGDAVLAILEKAELLTLTTINAGGWPIGACMHFAAVADRAGRPVIFMFANEHTRKLSNIAANPRVSATMFRPRSDDDVESTPYVRLQGVARHITEPDEFNIGLQANFNKEGYEFTRYIGIEKQPAIRLDVMRVLWRPTAAGPDALIDYTNVLADASA